MPAISSAGHPSGSRGSSGHWTQPHLTHGLLQGHVAGMSDSVSHLMHFIEKRMTEMLILNCLGCFGDSYNAHFHSLQAWCAPKPLTERRYSAESTPEKPFSISFGHTTKTGIFYILNLWHSEILLNSYLQAAGLVLHGISIVLHPR